MAYLAVGLTLFCFFWLLFVWYLTNANRPVTDRPLIFHSSAFQLLCWSGIALLFISSSALLYNYNHLLVFAPLALLLALSFFKKRRTTKDVYSLTAFIVHEYANAIRDGKSDLDAKREVMMSVAEYRSASGDYHYPLHILIYSFLQMKGLVPKSSITDSRIPNNIENAVKVYLQNEGVSEPT